MHGLGNDFVLIDSQNNPELYINGKVNLTKKELALLANRNYGIGCDQILFIEPASNDKANFDYLIYNQDGSKALYCGNGARCVVSYLANTYQLANPIILNTHGKISYGSPTETGQITISMGQPDFNPINSGYTAEANQYGNYSFLFGNNLIPFGIVSMGNPHAIIALNSQSQLSETEKLTQIAKALQNSKLFTDSVNVSFFFIDKNNAIRLRTYERGAGFTLSCGTGACATAIFAMINKLCDNHILVHTAGGSLQIKWDRGHEVEMTGDATDVFDGIISI